MKLFTGWILSAGLVVMAAAANAQGFAPYETGRSPYTVVSDVEGPYAVMPPEAPGPRYGPALLPPTEVYAILRENGFLPLGIPQQRGLVYTIAVIDRGGDDGRLVIDARNGRIIRFVPADRMGDNFDEGLRGSYGAVGSLPPVSAVRGPPRPPASIPHVASRTPSADAESIAAYWQQNHWQPGPAPTQRPRRCRPNRQSTSATVVRPRPSKQG
jgi:hypothetical protein